jgi:hypothetical protein
MALAIVLWVCLSIIACFALLRAAVRHRVPPLEDLSDRENPQISDEKRSSPSPAPSGAPQAKPARESTFSHSLTE